MSKTSIYGLTFDQLETWLVEHGQKKCILQLKSLEKCKEKFRTLPALNFDVTNDLIKHFSRGNYHQ